MSNVFRTLLFYSTIAVIVGSVWAAAYAESECDRCRDLMPAAPASAGMPTMAVASAR